MLFTTFRFIFMMHDFIAEWSNDDASKVALIP